MADTAVTRSQVDSDYTGPRFLGAPVGDFSVLQTIMLTLASGAIAFFIATFLSIMTLLVFTMFGRKADFTITYRYFGVPAAIVMFLVAGIYLTFVLIQRIRRQKSSSR